MATVDVSYSCQKPTARSAVSPHSGHCDTSLMRKDGHSAAGDSQCLSVLWRVHIALDQDAKCAGILKRREVTDVA
jgi:hypothetical protein